MIGAMTCGPLGAVVVVATIVLLAGIRKGRWPQASALWTIGIVMANAAFAAWNFTYYQLHPVAESTAPWKDPEVLNFGLLFLTVPVGMVVGAVAATQGASKWMIAVLEVASVPLGLLGLFACAAV